MSVLRIYDPAECDERGVPLDLERCRTCRGSGRHGPGTPEAYVKCATCGGHGSLKAAALAERLRGDVLGLGKFDTRTGSAPALVRGPDREARCEGCGHPMSDGAWQHELDPRAWPDWIGSTLAAAEVMLREGREPWPDGAGFSNADTARGLGVLGVHWSPCDEGCRHGGPARGRDAAGLSWVDDLLFRTPIGERLGKVGGEVEASWRDVDVRTLDWPHDLRPEKLAVLCLRCWAERLA